jgi:hypothetical protein
MVSDLIDDRTIRILTAVLILVVVEYGLGPNKSMKRKRTDVLILVVVEILCKSDEQCELAQALP